MVIVDDDDEEVFFGPLFMLISPNVKMIAFCLSLLFLLGPSFP